MRRRVGFGVDQAAVGLPWVMLSAPFEGGWCVVRPGEEPTAHKHHEYEIFIAMIGHVDVCCGQY